MLSETIFINACRRPGGPVPNEVPVRQPRRTTARTIAGLAVGALALVAVLTGCSGASRDSSATRPLVVTSTNVWASISRAVVGDHGTVRALYTSADGDPHGFTPSAADSASVADADIVVMNGGHYDQYLADAAKAESATVIDAAALLGISGDDDAHGDGDRAHHGSDTPNEHVFYNLTAVRKAATALAGALAAHAPAHAADYRRNATAFDSELDGLQAELDAIAARHRGTKVAQTEPLAGYLIAAAGLVDASPPAFTAAVANGQSPSAADRAKLDDLLTSHTAKALLYNTQAAGPVTVAVRATAERAGVPVVSLTESLPAGTTSYVVWQRDQIAALARALRT